MLGQVKAFLSTSSIPEIYKIVRRENKSKQVGAAFMDDPQYERLTISVNSSDKRNYHNLLFAFEDYNIIADTRGAQTDLQLENEGLLFFLGYIKLNEDEVPILDVKAISSAKNINLDIYRKTVSLINEVQQNLPTLKCQ